MTPRPSSVSAAPLQGPPGASGESGISRDLYGRGGAVDARGTSEGVATGRDRTS
ncbi:hypothetical protein SUDANB176_05628 [Streptomyces sp. enrichment culture]